MFTSADFIILTISIMTPFFGAGLFATLMKLVKYIHYLFYLDSDSEKTT